jgi:hypothetical protein
MDSCKIYCQDTLSQAAVGGFFPLRFVHEPCKKIKLATLQFLVGIRDEQLHQPAFHTPFVVVLVGELAS